MIKACLLVSPYYAGNRIFDMNDKVSNRDNCLYPFYALKQEFSRHDFDLATQDIHSPDASDIVIYNEMPQELPRQEDINKSHLLIFESELIRPDNWDVRKHQYFSKIFTWNDAIIDNNKYFKINFSHLFTAKIKKSSSKIKLCALIAGAKPAKHPLEIYSKRLEAIRWFEKSHPDDFDLYGIGLDGYKLISRKWSQKLHDKSPFFAKCLPLRFPSYRGRIEEKRPVLERYKF